MKPTKKEPLNCANETSPRVNFRIDCIVAYFYIFGENSMRIVSYLTVLALATAPLAGCASSSKEISAAYVSPIMYQGYSCQQLAGEMQRISARVQQVSGTVDGRASNDAAMMGIGLILFWPSLFFIKGDGPEAQELARLKGEYDAVNQAAIRQNCGTAQAPAAMPVNATTPAGSEGTAAKP